MMTEKATSIKTPEELIALAQVLQNQAADDLRRLLNIRQDESNGTVERIIQNITGSVLLEVAASQQRAVLQATSTENP